MQRDPTSKKTHTHTHTKNKTKDTSKAELKNILRRTFQQLSWFYLREIMLVHIQKIDCLTNIFTFPHTCFG